MNKNTKTERPILFNAEMVNAILAGRKTQTRRVVKPQPTTCNDDRGGHWWPSNAVQSMVHIENELQDYDGNWGGLIETCNPFGEIGDRLWVRETHALIPSTAYRASDVQQVINPDDNETASIFKAGFSLSQSGFKWKPSIHMPRWACRIVLEITKIRIERLQDITKEDAKAEGFDYSTHPSAIKMGYAVGARTNFRHTWEEIYGTTSWNQNPWVWVVEFKVVQGVSQ